MSESLGVVAALASLCLYAITTLLTRLATDRVSSEVGLMVVTAVSVVSCVIAVVAMGVAGWVPSGASVGPVLAFCAAGVFSAYLGRWLLFESVIKLGPARASAFQTSVPAFTALVGWIFLGEYLAADEWLAMATTLAGLLLVSQHGSGQQAAGPTHPRLRWDLRLLGIGLASALSYALGHVCRGYAIRSWNEPLLGVLLGAVTGLLLQVLAGGRMRAVWARVAASDRAGLGISAGVGLLGMIAQLLAIWAMLSLTTGKVALIMTATPLLVFPASWLFFKRFESITRYTVLGLLLALSGIGYLVAASGTPGFRGH